MIPKSFLTENTHMKAIIAILVILFGVTLGLAQTTPPTTAPSTQPTNVPYPHGDRFDWKGYVALVNPTQQQKLDWLNANLPTETTYVGDIRQYIAVRSEERR